MKWGRIRFSGANGLSGQTQRVAMKDSVTTKPKYRQISEQVHLAIRSGKYVLGQRLPSEAELVRRISGLAPTVARAMRDLERAGAVTRRVGSGTYVSPRARPARMCSDS